jgi:LysR family glycine cleavage system transcriptional activator
MDDAGRIRGAPLNALRSFEAAARRMSFVAAAEELGVTASAVSVQIKRLEARIGRPLFVRGHRSVKLSAIGARLAPALTAVFLDLDRLLAEIVEPASDSLLISAMPSFATKWLAPRLTDFSSRKPSFPVRVAGADHLVDFDRDGVDVGLRYGPGGYAPLHAEKLADARAFAVCSPAFLAAHPSAALDPAALLELPLISDETSLRAPGLPNWAGWFVAAGVKSAAALRGPVFESAHMALEAAVGGRGAALGLTPLVDEDLRAGRLVRLFETELASPYSFWFVCRKDRLRERKIRAFRDWVVAAVADAA